MIETTSFFRTSTKWAAQPWRITTMHDSTTAGAWCVLVLREKLTKFYKPLLFGYHSVIADTRKYIVSVSISETHEGIVNDEYIFYSAHGIVDVPERM
jgi:hypothetical protein